MSSLAKNVGLLTMIKSNTDDRVKTLSRTSVQLDTLGNGS